MIKTITILFFAMGVAYGCSTSQPCERLAVVMCDGNDQDYCAQVNAFLEARLVDEQGNPLPDSARQTSCQVILDNVELLGAYRYKAKQRITGEQDIELNRRTREVASQVARDLFAVFGEE